MGTSYAPNIVKDGLVLNVDPANLRSYPRSGTDVTDLVNNVTGDVNNGASWSNRKLGAFYYDRVNNIDSMINELTSEKTENLKNLTFPITELVNNSSYIDIYEN